MGVTVVKSLGELGKKIDKSKLEPVMKRISQNLVSSAVKKINKGIQPANAPLTQAVKSGNKTLRDNGTLMASIAPHSGQTWASAGTNLKYAKIQQEGGTVTSKGKGLWLPAGKQTRWLSRKYNAQSPGQLISAMKSDGYSFYRAGKVFFAKKKQGQPFPLFVIKQSVTIPARPFLYIDDDDEKYIMKEIRKAIRQQLGGKQ